MTQDKRMQRAQKWAQEWANQTGNKASEIIGEAWILSDKSRKTEEALICLQKAYKNEAPMPSFGPVSPPDAEYPYGMIGLKTSISKAMLNLSPREQRVLSLTYGIGPGVDPQTFEEIAEQFDVNTSRIRHILHTAIRKLRHPARSGILGSYTDTSYNSANFCEKPYIRQSPSWSGFRYALSRMGYKNENPLWAWHGCPIVQKLFETKTLQSIDQVMSWSKPDSPHISHAMIGSDKYTFNISPGVLSIEKIEFSGGHIYRQYKIFCIGKRYKITPIIDIDKLPRTIAEALSGIQGPAALVIDNPLFENFLFNGCCRNMTGHSLELIGYTAPLGRGSGKFLHPEGLVTA